MVTVEMLYTRNYMIVIYAVKTNACCYNAALLHDRISYGI